MKNQPCDVEACYNCPMRYGSFDSHFACGYSGRVLSERIRGTDGIAEMESKDYTTKWQAKPSPSWCPLHDGPVRIRFARQQKEKA